eukprot:CAMPEP_0184042854 /NCGR_PEP_ID=MMETSP0955-20130417/66589_1 /TAXON_ID=627963 /ORGANISM="Aplanochytrium sp, Strain PBS07" /LENGTH=440 /DNA_ID=CAMNT_0026333683 /DNA_START=198 /DNA_END=1520 /DNA_ORIENTATION=+
MPVAGRGAKIREKKGEWDNNEELQLLDLMSKFGQDWSSIRKVMDFRSFHGIKVKGRNLLGETAPKVTARRKKGCKEKKKIIVNPEFWSAEEHERLIKYHEKYGYDLLEISKQLGTYRPAAKIDRELLSRCQCADCSKRMAALRKTGLSLKTSWTKVKARELYCTLLDKMNVMEMSEEKKSSDSDDDVQEIFTEEAKKIRCGPRLDPEHEKTIEKFENHVKLVSGSATKMNYRELIDDSGIKDYEVVEFGKLLSEKTVGKDGLSYGESLSMFYKQSDLKKFIAVARKFGLMPVDTPSIRYMLRQKISTGDPRYNLGFLFPSRKQFYSQRPIGSVVFHRATCLVMDTDDNLRNQVDFPNMIGKHWFYPQPSAVGALFLFGNLLPRLMRDGEVWIHQRIVKPNGKVGIYLAHIKPYGMDACRFRYQEVTDKFPKIANLPPELF